MELIKFVPSQPTASTASLFHMCYSKCSAHAPSTQLTAYSEQENTGPDSPDALQEGVLRVKLLQEQDLWPLGPALHLPLQAGSVGTGEQP